MPKNNYPTFKNRSGIGSGQGYSAVTDEPPVIAPQSVEGGTAIAKDLWAHGLTDTENLSSARDILGRGYGFLPGELPTLRVEQNFGPLHVQGYDQEAKEHILGFSQYPFPGAQSPHQSHVPEESRYKPALSRDYPEGLPFDPRETRNPRGGTVVLRPHEGPNADLEELKTLNHEMAHEWYSRNLDMPSYQSKLVDYTHGPQGAAAFYPGRNITENPYYRDVESSTPWHKRTWEPDF